MGVAYFIVLNNENPSFDTSINGKYLAKYSEDLDSIAKILNLPTLDDFVSYSPAETLETLEDFGIDPETIPDLDVPEIQWFDPVEGLDCVAQVITYIQANPKSVGNPDDVLSDLNELKGVLDAAKAINARWNLQIDY